MGGIIFVMAGDFRQTLPIVDRGTRANEVEACIKNSKIWKKVKGNFKLTTNMRAYLGKLLMMLLLRLFQEIFFGWAMVS